MKRFTDPSRCPWHVRHHHGRRPVMRIYIRVLVTILGLLGAYVALLPLIT
ncbi:MAG: hypothetical protein QOG25_2145 [Acetobacteraceae bacterium]|nr:hypothetical protein [Acetobacteraceae bacterium]